MNINDIKAIQGAVNVGGVGAKSIRDLEIQEAKARLSNGMSEDALSLDPNSKRNGVAQQFVFTRTKSRYKYNIMAFPDEPLYVGDIIDYYDEKWIVEETNVASPLSIIGTVRLCNIKLRFQNGTSTIIERYASLDSGVYSTTLTGDDQVQSPDKQFKLYLPYDEATKYLYVDKRLAVDTRYDNNGNEILETYIITGTNKIARSYGTGGHLLICELRSSIFSPEHDSIANMICDYIEPGVVPPTPVHDIKITINGRNKIGLATTRNYTAVFKDSTGAVVQKTPVWNVTTTVSGVSHTVSNNILSVNVSDNESAIGYDITISVYPSDDSTNVVTKKVEVIA